MFLLYLIPAIMLVIVLAGTVAVVLPALGYDPLLVEQTPGWPAWQTLLAHPGLVRAVMLSLISGIVTTAISLAIVFTFLAGAQATRRWSERLIGPLLAMPHAAAAIGLAFLIAPSGWLMRLVSPWATGLERPPDILIPGDPFGLSLVLGLVIKEVPFIFLVAVAVLPLVRERERVVLARSLGYGRMAGWLKTVAPDVYRRIRLPVMAVIAYASSNVEVALILGPSNPPTLAVLGLRLFGDPDLAMRGVASAAASLQIMVTLFAILLWLMFERLAGQLLRRGIEAGERMRPGYPAWLFGRVTMIAVIMVSVMIIAGLLINSIAWSWRFPDVLPSSYTARHWLQAAPALGGPLTASVALGLCSAVIGLGLVMALLELQERYGIGEGMRKAVTVILFTPLLVPQIGFVSGLVLLFELAGVRPGFPAVLLGHLVTVIPYIYLSIGDPYRQFDRRYLMVAAGFRAGPMRSLFFVRLPMMTNALLAALAIGFAVSIGQYLPTLLLSAGRTMTVTTEAVALVSGGDRRVLGVWAFIQTALPALMFLIAMGLPRMLWRNRLEMRTAA